MRGIAWRSQRRAGERRGARGPDPSDRSVVIERDHTPADRARWRPRSLSKARPGLDQSLHRHRYRCLTRGCRRRRRARRKWRNGDD